MHGADHSMSVRLDGVAGGAGEAPGRRLKRMGKGKGEGGGEGSGGPDGTKASKSSPKFNVGTVRRGIDEILGVPGGAPSQQVVRFAAMLRHCLDDLDDLRAEYDATRAGQHEQAPGSPIRRLAGDHAKLNHAGGTASTAAGAGTNKSKSKRSRRESSYGSVRADRVFDRKAHTARRSPHIPTVIIRLPGAIAHPA